MKYILLLTILVNFLVGCNDDPNKIKTIEEYAKKYKLKSYFEFDQGQALYFVITGKNEVKILDWNGVSRGLYKSYDMSSFINDHFVPKNEYTNPENRKVNGTDVNIHILSELEDIGKRLKQLEERNMY